MSSRDKILKALRANRRPFEDVTPRPEAYLPVTRIADNTSQNDLIERFAAEARQRDTEVHVVPDTEAAIQTVLDIIGDDQSVLAWEDLPLPGLVEALAARTIKRTIPYARAETRITALEAAETVRVGISGADAGFATTGTLALVTSDAQGRIPSLLPPVHIALLRRDRIVPRMEDWFVEQGRAALQNSRSVALVTGPSTTGDIEQQSIRGVHGPGTVHVVVF